MGCAAPIFSALGIIVFLAGTSWGATFHVATNGNDTAGNGSPGSPYLTIGKGVSQASAGDTVYVRGGTYIEMVTLSKSGTSNGPIVLAGYPGESAIIDGAGALPAGDNTPPGKTGTPSAGTALYKALLKVTGDYVEVRDLTVRASRGRGVLIQANQVLLHNLNVSSNWNGGINITGDHVTLEDSAIWENAQSNTPEQAAARTYDAIWPGCLMAPDSTFTTIRRCRVYQNYGEGIIDLRAYNSVIEDNVCFNNWAVDIYLDCSHNATIRRNLAYYTSDLRYWRNPDAPGPGIAINEEYYASVPTNTPGTGWKIYNNFVYNAGVALNLWPGEWSAVGVTVPFDDALIAYNTLVNTRTGTYGNASAGMNIIYRPSTNSVVRNNLVIQTAGKLTKGAPDAGVLISHNSFFGPASTLLAAYTNACVTADPLLQLGAGEVPDTNWLKIASSSPVRASGVALANVTTDFFGTARGAQPDIGAYQLTAALPNLKYWLGYTTAYAQATNWSPAGTPASTDIIVFDNHFTGSVQCNNGNVHTQSGVWMAGAPGKNVSLTGANVLFISGTNINGNAATGILKDNTDSYPLTLSCPLSLTANQTWLNHSSGLLLISGLVTNADTTLTLGGTGTGGITIASPIRGTAGNILVNASGSAPVILAGTNAHTGWTTVSHGTLLVTGNLGLSPVTVQSGGTLGGSGILGGPVSVQAGALLQPGNGAVGKLTINNSLTLDAASQTFLAINSLTATNDLVAGMTSLTYGGILTVTNLAGTNAPGDAYRLFSASTTTGNFSQLNLPALNTGLSWNWNPTNGMLSVISTLALVSINLNYILTANTLTLTWPGSHRGWYAQSNSAKLTDSNAWFDLPDSQLGTNLTLPISPAHSQIFYRLRTP